MKKIALFALAVSALFSTSCSNSSEEEFSGYVPFSNPYVKYDSNGVWDQVYDDAELIFDKYQFTHYGESGSYNYYYGFVPSKSENTSSYTTTDQWLKHQWSTIEGHGIFTSTPYIVGNWESYIDQVTDVVPDNPSCAINRVDGGAFRPMGIFVSNTTWGYYSMLNGSEMYPTPFGDKDNCELIICGALRGIQTGKITVTLADGKNISKNWIPVELDKLGTVDMIYFQMKSTVKNENGICNPPTCFCIDGFFVYE